MRVHSLCKILRKMDILQDVLALTHKRSLDKYSELDREDDFDETAEAPEIQCKCLQCHDSVIKWQEVITVSLLSALTHQKPEITPPSFSTVQVTDIFQKLVSKHTN